MTITYCPEEDTLRILLRDAPIHQSEVHPAGLVLDFDQHGGILGLEIASASDYISRPDALTLVNVTGRRTAGVVAAPDRAGESAALAGATI